MLVVAPDDKDQARLAAEPGTANWYVETIASRQGRCVHVKQKWYRGGDLYACVNTDASVGTCSKCGREIYFLASLKPPGSLLGWTCPNPECGARVSGTLTARPAVKVQRP
jgi:hypothetical protein